MTPARRGALLVLVGIGAAGWVVPLAAPLHAREWAQGDRAVVILEVPGVSLDRILEIPSIRGLASAGGAGLLAGGYEPPPSRVDGRVLREVVSVDDLGDAIAAAAGLPAAADVLVMVVGTGHVAEAVAAKDETLPIVVACCDRMELLAAIGGGGPSDPAALDTVTSDSTRRDGVVVSADVAATAAAFLRLDASTGGEPIRVVAGPPPLELHERYLAHRRMSVPIGGAAAIYLAIAGLGAIAVLGLGTRAPIGLRRAFGWACLSVAMLAVGLLSAGHLPELTYATVVPFVAIVTAFGTMAFAPLERWAVTLVPVGIGACVLAFFVVEAALGWRAALTPFVGGSQLDGGRFYGLPNASVGLLIGSSMWVAHRLRTSRGFALVVVVALGAGLPLLGSNLGGGVSLFAAAGLWLAIRRRSHFGGWGSLGVFLAVTAAGTTVILLAHALSPVVTHITRFGQHAGGLGGIVGTIRDQLEAGFDLLVRNPLALIPVLGLPVAILTVLRPPAPLRPSLEAEPAWRDAILTTLIAGVVAYLANDSGPAAAGLAFGLGLGGLLGVSLLVGAGKMGEP